jgi:hypothetical protein
MMMRTAPGDVRFRVKCGLNIVAASISAHDPKQTLAARRGETPVIR